jgi:enoyl-CoA hydratase/carnithine racemase
MTSQIRIDVDGSCAIVTLNRPEKKNALTPEMNAELFSALREAEANDRIGAIVVTGSGDTFCSGADVNWYLEHRVRPALEQSPEARYETAVRAMLPAAATAVDIFDNPDDVRLMMTMRTPIIAAMNGSALGYGLTFTLPCDVRVLSAEARVGMLFVRRAMVPDFGSLYFLPRLVGIGHATEMCLTGRTVAAEEALRIGLVSEVVAPNRVLDRAMEIANTIASNPRAPVGFIRQAMHRSASLDDVLEFQRITMELCRVTPEYVGRMETFRDDKRAS